MPDYLFVCGTLRKAQVAQTNPQLVALMQGLRFIGIGSLPGQLFDLGEYPGANVGENFATKIIGEVYEMPDARATLEVLDVYEGFIPGELEASLFARRKEKVTLTDDQQLECWMYVYNDWVLNGRLIESGDYVEYLKSIRQDSQD